MAPCSFRPMGRRGLRGMLLHQPTGSGESLDSKSPPSFSGESEEWAGLVSSAAHKKALPLQAGLDQNSANWRWRRARDCPLRPQQRLVGCPYPARQGRCGER